MVFLILLQIHLLIECKCYYTVLNIFFSCFRILIFLKPNRETPIESSKNSYQVPTSCIELFVAGEFDNDIF